MTHPVDENKGLKGLLRRRLVNTSVYAWRGFCAAWQSEESFRLELVAAAIMIPVALIQPVAPGERALLVIVVALVLIAELLNSAVEAVTDRIGSEFHVLSAKAKDVGSAAVFVSLMLVLAVWSIILVPVYF